MQATCSEPTCGKTFEAKRATARFCSSGCRVKTTRRRAAAGEQPPAAPANPSAGTQGDNGSASLLVAATIDELAKANRLGTALGQAALVLAEKAGNRFDTGSATAAVVRQLQATLAAALQDAEQAADPIDELEKRRRSKAAGA